jgi:hypothetical protein
LAPVVGGLQHGEANVARIRNTAQIDDYWEMVDRGYLPSETRQYVPRALAAMEIAASPEEYGFEKQEGSPTRYDQVVIDKAISLKTVADSPVPAWSKSPSSTPPCVAGSCRLRATKCGFPRVA